MSILDGEGREVLQIMCERNAYRDVLAEITEELLPKLKQIHARLHAGSDAMRDEGHKLMLVCNDLDNLLTREGW
jgi:uncharacterized membrane-anchored protein